MQDSLNAADRQGVLCRLWHHWGSHIASHCRMVKVMATLANHSGSSPAAFPPTHKSVVAIPISQETKFLAPGHWQLAEVWQARPLQGIRNACRAPSVPTFAPGDTLAFCKCSATGTRTRVARVRAEYPNQLDYSGVWTWDGADLPSLSLFSAGSSSVRRSVGLSMTVGSSHTRSTAAYA